MPPIGTLGILRAVEVACVLREMMCLFVVPCAYPDVFWLICITWMPPLGSYNQLCLFWWPHCIWNYFMWYFLYLLDISSLFCCPQKQVLPISKGYPDNGM